MRFLAPRTRARLASLALASVCVASVGAQPVGAAAPTAVEPGSTSVYFEAEKDDGHSCSGSATGRVSWDGEGGYSFDGRVDAYCLSKRLTSWIEYGGTSESWKQTAEADTSGVRSIPVKFSGKLALGEKLEMRVSTWRAGTVSPYYASPKRVFTIS
ncbi:hypothetical protein [Streptomyces sp. NPDC094049]|uniref:hypothetical protein n=1 Tax=Streptomyces sp. NPDC094049 TaxID=3154987 RepID=UPI00332FF362